MLVRHWLCLLAIEGAAGILVPLNNSSHTPRLPHLTSSGGRCRLGVDTCVASTYCEKHANPDESFGVCIHKPLLPLDGRDLLAFALVFSATALAAGGGIGGGGLIVPIYLLVSNWPATQATALSLATISGGSIANLATYTQRYHPTAQPPRPVIDYDAALLFCPAMLAGTTLGTMFSVTFPDLLTVILLVLVLGYSGRRTLRTGLKKWKAQSATAAVCVEAQPNDSDQRAATAKQLESMSLSRVQELPEASGASSSAATPDPVPDTFGAVAEEFDAGKAGVSDELAAIYHDESNLLPLGNLALTGVIWVIVLVSALLRGGNRGASVIGTQCGSELYWFLFFGNMAAMLAFTAYLRSSLLVRSERKRELGCRSAKGDLEWTQESTWRYPVIAVTAGVLAGLLGIGGGMVLGPMLVALGCLPVPVSATSAYFVFISATSGLCQVIIFGSVPFDYGVVVGVLGLGSTFIGQRVVEALIRKFKKDAVVVLIIGAIMIVALVLMTAAGIRELVEGGALQGFQPLCPVQPPATATGAA